MDRRLRETADATSPPLPPFSAPNRVLVTDYINPFLVILNAGIKFRRYFRQAPPEIPLPDVVQELMRKSMELIELVYWKPEMRPGTRGEFIIQRRAFKSTSTE